MKDGRIKTTKWERSIEVCTPKREKEINCNFTKCVRVRYDFSWKKKRKGKS